MDSIETYYMLHQLCDLKRQILRWEHQWKFLGGYYGRHVDRYFAPEKFYRAIYDV
ncbi:hypothetical protein QJS04_geneDACA007363 [Acorus gramineus]|uniref:Uncharacterized protein n=1 Tax=Acorus gramineus TaxID=55184 RepID=A0AAV9BMJ3_ACOGR|nr:hypothetical protein QJS04_geneDACA007363 [Acorus gramineus]